MPDARTMRTRSLVVKAATELLLETGAGAVTVEAVIRRSGVARSTIYRHFPTSTDVLRAAVDEVIPAPKMATTDASDLDEDALLHELDGLLRGLVDGLNHSAWARALPGLLDLLGRDPLLEEHRSDLLRYHREPLRRLLLQAQRLGLLAADADLDTVTAALVGPLFYRHLIGGEALTHALYRDLLSLVIPQVSTRPPRTANTSDTNLGEGNRALSLEVSRPTR